MNKNQDQKLDYRMDSVSENVSENASEKVSENVSENVSEKVSENVSDARLSQIFGEALGDEPSKEETLGKLSRRSIFLQRRNHYRRQKMNCLRKR